MIALDTNVLVHARRADSPFHGVANRIVIDLANGERPWAIPWPCIYEFVRVLTHPRFNRNPQALDDILQDLAGLMDSPSLTLLGEGPAHRRHFLDAVTRGAARGNLAFDAHIAALAIEHGVRELWTADRDFRRYPGLTIRNPFIASDEVHEVRVRYRPRVAAAGAPAGRRSR